MFPFLDLSIVNRPYADAINTAIRSIVATGPYIGGNVVKEFESNLSYFLARNGLNEEQAGEEKENPGSLPLPRVVGVSNGLDALRLILRAYIEIGRINHGDEVIVPANTYIASVLAITDAGLVPVLAEPSPLTLNLDTARLERYLTPRTRVVMPVHLYGRVCWDDNLKKFARENNLLVVEDNAQGIGAVAATDGLNGCRSAGALGHAGAFSFYPTKNLGAMGDAGAVATFDPELATAVRALANYGCDSRYHNIYEGFNCRLDPIQAAVLNVKLPDLNHVNAQRRLLADIYRENIQSPYITLPAPTDTPLEHVYHQFIILASNRQRLLRYMTEHGIGHDIHYPTAPHRQPCYQRLNADHSKLKITDELSSKVVSIPISSCTSENDALEIAKLLSQFQ